MLRLYDWHVYQKRRDKGRVLYKGGIFCLAVFGFDLGQFRGLQLTDMFDCVLQDIAATWEVQAMPTFIFIQNKKLVHKIVGSNKDELEKKSVQFSASHHT